MDNGSDRVSTGIASLDQITYGGLPRGEMYVVNGAPGTGKTILSLHFLQAGVAAGETTLCIALSQRSESIKRTAASVGINAEGITFRELNSVEALESMTQQQTVFDTSALELEDTMNAITEIVETVQPERVVFDGISFLRMLASDPLIYRRLLLRLRDYLLKKDATAILTDTQVLAPGDSELVTTVHGVLELSETTTSFASTYRHLKISKVRGIDYQEGIHDVEITNQGMRVYPLSHQQDSKSFRPSQAVVSSGIARLDQLVGGSLLMGTSCLLIGPSGTGKSSIATQFASHFVSQGGKVSVVLFDELTNTFLLRSRSLGMAIDPADYPDQVRIREMGLGETTPGKFFHLLMHDVDKWGAQMVIVDSLTGYTNAMPQASQLISQMHELLMALNRRGVLTILVVAQHGVVGPNLDEGIDISYLADTVLLLRHFEAMGSLHRAISVYKKRYGTHEAGIREVHLKPGGIHIGEPLRQFTGILSGLPSYASSSRALLEVEE